MSVASAVVVVVFGSFYFGAKQDILLVSGTMQQLPIYIHERALVELRHLAVVCCFSHLALFVVAILWWCECYVVSQTPAMRRWDAGNKITPEEKKFKRRKEWENKRKKKLQRRVSCLNIWNLYGVFFFFVFATRINLKMRIDINETRHSRLALQTNSWSIGYWHCFVQ